MSLASANDRQLQEHIRTGGIVLADFGSAYCPPCRQLQPILEELDHEYGDRVKIVKIDVDESPDTANELGIMGVPTVVLYTNGQPVDKLVGLRPKAVYEQLIARSLEAAY